MSFAFIDLKTCVEYTGGFLFWATSFQISLDDLFCPKASYTWAVSVVNGKSEKRLCLIL